MSEDRIFMIVVASCIGGGVLVWIIAVRTSKRTRRRRFSDREALSFAKWFDLYYGGSDLDREVLLFAIEELSRVLSIKPTQLLPSDSIEDLICPGWWAVEENADVEYCLLDINSFANRRHGKDIDLASFEKMSTLNDFFRHVAARATMDPTTKYGD